MIQACPQCQADNDITSFRPGDTVVCVACKHPFRLLATRYAPFPSPPDRAGRDLFPSIESPSSPLHAAREKARRPSLTIDGYDVLEILGKGGMGQVYRAIQKSLGREVAIKTLDPTLARNQASVMRFTKEAAAMARLHHPNIVYVIDRGFCRQRHFFVMEFIDGPSLRDMLHEGPFSPSDAVSIISDLSRTMAYAHSQGVIHRDLKPENLLYTRSNVLKVADFGLAGVNEETTHIRKLTRSFVSMGTECYMAPEQRRDAKNVDHRADIYSIGVLLYELLTQQLPFPHLPSPETPIIPGHPKIDAIIRRCLETSPLKRFETTEELCLALDDARPLPSKAPELQDARDTVAETTAIPSPALLSAPPSPPKSKSSFLHRLSQWPRRLSEIAKRSSQEPSLTPHNFRSFAFNGLLAAFVVGLVALFYFFAPAAPVRDAQGKTVMLSWEQQKPRLHTLPDQRKALRFELPPTPKRGLFQKPPLVWRSQGHWFYRDNELHQNTFLTGIKIDKVPSSALYQGHALASKGFSFQSTIRFESPRVTEGKETLSLEEYLRRADVRSSGLQPSLGIAFQSSKRIFALWLKRTSRGLSARLLSASDLADLALQARQKNPPQAITFSTDGRSPLTLRLDIRNDRLSASIHDRSLPEIALSPDEIPSLGHPAFFCRDAHCAFADTHVSSSSL